MPWYSLHSGWIFSGFLPETVSTGVTFLQTREQSGFAKVKNVIILNVPLSF